jgi:hypothetical protein
VLLLRDWKLFECGRTSVRVILPHRTLQTGTVQDVGTEFMHVPCSFVIDSYFSTAVRGKIEQHL